MLMIPEYQIRPMLISELPRFYRLITADFIPGEYPPRDILETHIKTGSMHGLVFCRDRVDCAYAVNAAGANQFVLISLLAVFQEFRGQGIGSDFVKAMIETYKDMQGIVIEVEKPELAEDSATKHARHRRISFYEKLGFNLINGIEYEIWGMPLHLMILPLHADRRIMNHAIGEIITGLYLGLTGKELIHKLVIKPVE